MRRSTAGYVALAAADVLLTAAGRTRERRVTKPLLMPVLAIGRTRATRAALGLGWAGDVALMAPGEAAFLAGLGSFLAGHAAWIVALRRRGDGGALRARPVRRAAALAEVAAAVALGAYLLPRAGKQRLPVLGYSLALLATGLVALDSRDRRSAAGGALFLASDALIAVQRFSGRSVPLGDAAVMASYTAAQGLLAAGDRG